MLDFDTFSAPQQYQFRLPDFPESEQYRHSPARRPRRCRAMLSAMSAQPDQSPVPPPLPPALLAMWPVPVIGALGWLLAVAAAFLLPALASWRPVTLAGLAVGVLGTSIFLLQLAAVRRGARGAQAGLENYLSP
jgi:hypothetical protein